MSIDLDEYNQLVKRAETAQREADKSAGVLEERKKKLKEEFGCSSIKEAEKLLGELEEKEADLERKFNKELEAFKKEFNK